MKKNIFTIPEIFIIEFSLDSNIETLTVSGGMDNNLPGCDEDDEGILK